APAITDLFSTPALAANESADEVVVGLLPGGLPPCEDVNEGQKLARPQHQPREDDNFNIADHAVGNANPPSTTARTR
ncbi:unnamed protein product, partial [Amoebophrya sp. A120]